MGERSGGKVWMFRGILAALAAVFAFGVAEAGARIWLMKFAEDEQLYDYATLAQAEARGIRAKYERHRFLGYVTTPNYRRGEKDRHNEWGFRDADFPMKKPAGEFRVICIGSSTTYSSTIKDVGKTYPSLLQDELHKRGHTQVRVINAGVPGWTTWESMVYFELHLLDFEPDMIILYDGINDVRPRMVWPPEQYKGDNSAMRQPLTSDGMETGFLERSTLLRIIMVKQGWILPQTAIERVWDQSTPFYHGEEFTRQVMQKEYPSGIFKEVPIGRMLEANPPKYFRNNVENIVIVAKARGIKVMLASFAYTKYVTEDKFILAPEVQAAIAETNTILREIAEKHGAEFYDFAVEMPDGINHYNDSVHNNERGSQVKAGLFAKFIGERRMIPAAVPP